MTTQTLTGDTSLVLPEFDQPPTDPIPLLRPWLDNAVTRGICEPHVMVLATVDRTGRPSTRAVTLKDYNEGGLVFTTSTASRKGTDLADRP